MGGGGGGGGGGRRVHVYVVAVGTLLLLGCGREGVGLVGLLGLEVGGAGWGGLVEGHWGWVEL